LVVPFIQKVPEKDYFEKSIIKENLFLSKEKTGRLRRPVFED